jgi:hypothetical protein
MPLTDSSHDFDFLFGSWRVVHHRLQARLAGCADWDEFDGSLTAWPILDGLGNVDDCVLHLPGGTYRAAAMRAYDPAQGTWSIWWLDGRTPHTLDVPVVGRFDGGVGEFVAADHLDGAPIVVRFRWLDRHTSSPRWEQAFSPDDGNTWETNWVMRFCRSSTVQDAAPRSP